MADLTLRNVKGSPLTNAEMDGNLSALNSEKLERTGAIPATGKITFVQSGSARASIRIPEGSADPTSPEVGDIWNNGGQIRFRQAAGTTVNLMVSTGDNTFDGNVEITEDLVVGGNLYVNGTVTQVNSTVVTVDDKNIELGSVDTPTNITADGGGITLKGATDKTLNWVNATSSWTSSEHMELASGKGYRINGNVVLTQTALGSTVLASSLTSVGTIATGVWQGTAVAHGFGGTGLTATPSNGQIPIGNGTGYSLAGITGTANRVTVTAGAGSITLTLPDVVQISGLGAGVASVAGEIRAAGEVSAFYTSDMTLKENIVDIPSPMATLERLGGYLFDWTDSHIASRGGEDGIFVRKHDVGVIAQEVETFYPLAAVTRPDGTKAVDYHRLIPLMIEAIKELNDRISE